MGSNSLIEWTDHTFNPWWGCTKVSPGCANCYAERLARRTKRARWGQSEPRSMSSQKVWDQPLQWNRLALKRKRRYRVFCGSMCDVFEQRSELDRCRSLLFEMIDLTSRLDWLLLTKRPQHIMDMIPDRWRDELPRNVGVGATVECSGQHERIVSLCRVPAHLRFLSCEPLLGPLNLGLRKPVPKTARSGFVEPLLADSIHWVIVGGESGPHARPMHPGWVRSLQSECAEMAVPFFFKQWGAWQPCDWYTEASHGVRDSDGYVVKMSHEPRSVGRAREAPLEWAGVWRVGKTVAGCGLDGSEHKQLPKQTQLFAA